MVITTIVDGFSNPNEADDYVAEEDFDEFDEDDDDDGKGGSKAMTRRLEELKNEALRRFDLMREMFEKIHKIYEKDGYGTPAYMKVQHALSEELMTIRFTAKTIEKLCDMVRAQVDDVRAQACQQAKQRVAVAVVHRSGARRVAQTQNFVAGGEVRHAQTPQYRHVVQAQAGDQPQRGGVE